MDHEMTEMALPLAYTIKKVNPYLNILFISRSKYWTSLAGTTVIRKTLKWYLNDLITICGFIPGQIRFQ